jgi:hypothetical protein
MLIENLKGGYLFLRGIAAYSSGAIAIGGFEIERGRLLKPLPFAAAFERIEAHLEDLERPPQSLCGIELRSPCPLTFADFDSFNGEYVRYIEKLGLPVDGLNPVARTNVSPEGSAPPEPVVYAFSYTVPASAPARTFVVAGTGELPEGSLDPCEVVRKCESSVEALIDKASFVHAVIDARVRGLGVTWDNVTGVNVYTVHDVLPAFVARALMQIGYSNGGVTWHHTRPPIVNVEYEMDVRGCAREVILTD